MITGHDRMEAERLTSVLGFTVTAEQVSADRIAHPAIRPGMSQAATMSRLEAVIQRAEARAAETDDLVSAATQHGTLTDLDRQALRRRLYDLSAHLERIADGMRK